jgi:hypothetical protein
MYGIVLAAALAVSTGPSTFTPPFVLPVAQGANTISIVTAGDFVGGPYRMTGAPDGLGAFDNGDGTFTVLMNHELAGTAGGVHAHGARGALVSKWTIRKSDLGVVRAEDLIQRVALWNRTTNSYDLPTTGITIANLCSANYHRATGIFFSGEENFEGRVFAHLLDGTSYELPRFGRAVWENAVMHPTAARTIVVGLDDVAGGYLYVYIGDKQASGTPIERAGLTTGFTYVVRVTGSTFQLVNLGNLTTQSGTSQRVISAASGGTQWERTEDGAWDPTHPNDFYFVTTATFNGFSRLWRLRFNSLDTPTAGGTIEIMLDGTEGPKMMDNITVRARGDVIIQEDPDGPLVARVWRYDPSADKVEIIAQHDPALFSGPGAISTSEESSGVIEISDILGDGWLLMDVQTHNPIAGDVSQGGQLIAMHLPSPRRHVVRH